MMPCDFPRNLPKISGWQKYSFIMFLEISSEAENWSYWGWGKPTCNSKSLSKPFKRYLLNNLIGLVHRKGVIGIYYRVVDHEKYLKRKWEKHFFKVFSTLLKNLNIDLSKLTIIISK